MFAEVGVTHLGFGWDRCASFGEEHMRSKVGERHLAVDVTEFVEERHTEATITEAATKRLDLTERLHLLAITGDSQRETLRGFLRSGSLIHLDQNEAAVCLSHRVHLENSMAR